MSKPKQNQALPNNSKIVIEPKRQTQVDKYFAKLTSPEFCTSSPKKLMAVSPYLTKTEKSLQNSIKKGKIDIKEQSDDLSELLIKQKINQEQGKAEQLRKKRDQLIRSINKLDMRENIQSDTSKITSKKYSHPDLLKFIPGGVLSRQEHENMVEKIKKAQAERDRNHEEYLRNLQQRLKQKEQSLMEAEQQKARNERQLRRMKSQHNMSIKKQQNQRKLLEAKKAKEQLEYLKKNPPLFKIKEQKFYKQVIAPSLEQKKKRLKEVRDFTRNFSVKEINIHQKKYLQEKNNSIKQSKIQSRIDKEWQYKPPSKTQKLTLILAEEQTEKKKRLLQSKKYVEQKILRQDNYVRLLKEKYYPKKTDPELEKQLQRRILKLHTERRQTPDKNPRQIGKQYLSLAKSRIRKSQDSQQIQKSKLTKSLADSATTGHQYNYLKTREDPEYYAQKKKQHLNKILSSKGQAMDKKKKLEIETKKIEEALAMKEQLLKIHNTPKARKDTAQLLLSGIKAKMGLIQLCQNTGTKQNK